MDKQIFTSKSEQETESFAASLASQLTPGSVLALHGDLGAGKTVFARGFARGLGITEPVSSPTYTIIQEYPLPQGHWLYHLDLYRIDNYIAALAFGVEEYLEDHNAYVLLEWPSRIPELIPAHTVNVHIEHLSADSRRITVSS